VSQYRRYSSSDRLKAVDFSLVESARRVIEGALSVVPGQKVLLVADEARIDLGNALLDACQQRNAALHPTIEQHLAQVEASVFIAGFVEGEAQMRREFVGCTTSYQVRHAHMVGVSRRAMLSGLSTDPRRIATVASSVRGVLRPQSVFRVRSVTGTDLEVVCDPRHRWAEHSGIIRRGMWENLPTGELMTTPGNVHGVFVCDAAMSEGFGSREGVFSTAWGLSVLESTSASPARSAKSFVIRTFLVCTCLWVPPTRKKPGPIGMPMASYC